MKGDFERRKRSFGKKNFSGRKKFDKKDSSGKRGEDSKEGYSKKPFRKNFKKPFYKKDFSEKRHDEKSEENKRKPFREKRTFQKNFRKPFYKKDFRKRQDDGREGENERKSFGQDKPFQKNFRKPFYKKKFGHKPFHKKSFQKTSERENESVKNDSGLIRLNKYISNSGVCSRREADELIKNGLITVNGKVVTEMGYKVSSDDEVRYGGDLLTREKNVYVLLNKPKDFITTTDDEHGRRNVLELVKNACTERIYPVGRLDRNTTGVLLFTNDGELTKKLTHPKHGIKKVYHVSLDKNLSYQDMQKVYEGVELEDGFIKADDISYADPVSKKEIGIEIHSGRNRVIRRIFEALGYKVTKLDRVVFAGLTKKDLPRGRWRFLTDKEVGFLKMLAN